MILAATENLSRDQSMRSSTDENITSGKRKGKNLEKSGERNKLVLKFFFKL